MEDFSHPSWIARDPRRLEVWQELDGERISVSTHSVDMPLGDVVSDSLDPGCGDDHHSLIEIVVRMKTAEVQCPPQVVLLRPERSERMARKARKAMKAKQAMKARLRKAMKTIKAMKAARPRQFMKFMPMKNFVKAMKALKAMKARTAMKARAAKRR